MKAFLLTAALAVMTATQPVSAQTVERTLLAQADAEAMTNGEIRKVDASAGKLTIKHEDIKSLAMPGMTMVFQAASPELLKDIKPGDNVKFAAAKVNGVLTVTKVEKQK